MADLMRIFDHLIDTDKIPDGVYHVVSGDYNIYVRMTGGVASEISKAEFESDVPTVDPPY